MARDAKQRTAASRGGAMGTSRPTATGHEGYARQWGMRDAHGNGARRCELGGPAAGREEGVRWRKCARVADTRYGGAENSSEPP